MISVGNYDRHCQVIGPDNRRGTAGGVKRDWVTLFTFFAAKSEEGTSSFLAAQVSNVEVTAIFETHYNAEIKARQRFICDGITYEILGQPREKGRREAMILQVKTIPA